MVQLQLIVLSFSLLPARKIRNLYSISIDRYPIYTDRQIPCTLPSSLIRRLSDTQLQAKEREKELKEAPEKLETDNFESSRHVEDQLIQVQHQNHVSALEAQLVAV